MKKKKRKPQRGDGENKSGGARVAEDSLYVCVCVGGG